MSTRIPTPKHVDLEADTPVIADLAQLDGLANFRLGNACYVIETDELPDDSYVAYVGYSRPWDTTAGAGKRELTFINYGPIGAMYARPVEIDGEQYFEVELPDRDELDDAAKARRPHENAHRAAVVPPVANTLEDLTNVHADAVDADSSDYTRGLHRGMALAFGLALADLTRRRDAAYQGDKRWSRDEHETNESEEST